MATKKTNKNIKSDSAVKKTFFDLIEGPKRLTIKVPEVLTEQGFPETCWVEVQAMEDSQEYFALMIEQYVNADEDGNIVYKSRAEQMAQEAKFSASLITAWETELFGELTREKAEKLLSIPRFFFVSDAIIAHRMGRDSFFVVA